MASKDQLYVGRVFETRDAFKLHMSLYTIANKFKYLVKPSEPGKMVLQCGGANCGWRIYVVKVRGSTRFEIRTVEAAHMCSVNERWGFCHHATSSIVGDMIRQRYVGPGVVPRPGSVREIMRTDHSVPISYWKAWRSREIAVELGNGNAETAYLALPSYLAKLAADEQLRDKHTKNRTQVEKEVRRDKHLLQPTASSMASRRKHTIRCPGLC
ncbi:hypothetical protein F2Q70_00029035 [Brassica cretica]|uniref:Transposase MuDR plant domain-containing protein n=1 Tax=Brassica cretica TaxID=69181 RepID=A0A8S9FEV4_BRACR|nr:hypothetical protein F2Q70_00029035 [Brassica cretica]